MTQSLKASFNPDLIDTLRRGIETRNVADVKSALESGLDPNVYTYKGAMPLLHPLLGGSYKNSPVSADMDATTFARNTAEIIDLLVQHGLSVAEPASRHETENCRYLIDHYAFSDCVGETSKLIVRALAETAARKEADLYQMSIAAQVRRYLNSHTIASEGHARMLINESLTVMQMLHETVRQRLLNPTSKEEKQLVDTQREKLGFWLQPFSPPSNASLMHTLFAPRKEPTPAPTADIKTGGPMEEVNKTQTKAPAAKASEDMAQAESMVQVLQRRPAAEVLADMEREFIGLDGAKELMHDIVIGELYDAACVVQDIAPTPDRHSALFLGNPGLGKTTFARRYAELLFAQGITGPNFIEISPGGAVGKYIGHTEAKIEAILETADVLFIDEAYDLVSGGKNSPDFGRKVLTAVLRAIENRPEMVVIMAGYSEEMDQMVSSNPGLSSRFSKQVVFEDMNRAQLGEVLDLMTGQNKYTLAPQAREHILDQIEASRETLGPREFGNARLVRAVVERFKPTLAKRFFSAATTTGSDMAILAAPGKEELRHVTLADAKAINYGMVLGSDSKKRAREVQAAAAAAEKKASTPQQSMNDLPGSHPDWQPSIGFGRTLKAERQPAAA